MARLIDHVEEIELHIEERIANLEAAEPRSSSTQPLSAENRNLRALPQ
jgi:hypothetical protein